MENNKTPTHQFNRFASIVIMILAIIVFILELIEIQLVKNPVTKIVPFIADLLMLGCGLMIFLHDRGLMKKIKNKTFTIILTILLVIICTLLIATPYVNIIILNAFK